MIKRYVAWATILAGSHAGLATADVDVYGKLNVTLNNLDQHSVTPAIDEWQLNSNASRLGVKGTYEIDDGLEAIYQLEYEVHVDDGASSNGDTFTQRNSFAGLKGRFGTILAGKHDTPLKLVQGKVDLFNDQVLGDIKHYMEGEDRASNIVMYTSPTVDGFSAMIAVMPGEDSAGATGHNGLADHVSVAVRYSNDSLTASLARNNDVDAQDTTRAVVEWNYQNTSLGLLWQQAKQVSGAADEHSWLISAMQKVDANWSLKAQYGKTDYSNNSDDRQVAIGVDRKLGKMASVFASLINVTRDTVAGERDDRGFAIGYEIKF